ncbi:alpha/beta hydrolase-fold protein [Streptomyces sp. GESEQ-35]|uniref:alpha/beta hydrolase-fold protein n=1 Tax=Streptomyces sp. GESEQ-35 TaxID=2812657 RepID=UPI001B31C0EB
MSWSPARLRLLLALVITDLLLWLAVSDADAAAPHGARVVAEEKVGDRLIDLTIDSPFYTDWFNAGRGGPPAVETFHLEEVRPLLERHYGAGTRRAAAGESQGGFGALSTWLIGCAPPPSTYPAATARPVSSTAPGSPSRDVAACSAAHESQENLMRFPW